MLLLAKEHETFVAFLQQFGNVDKATPRRHVDILGSPVMSIFSNAVWHITKECILVLGLECCRLVLGLQRCRIAQHGLHMVKEAVDMPGEARHGVFMVA